MRKKELTNEQIEEICELSKNEAETKDICLSELKTKLENGELILDPDYQRNDILSPKEMSKFIESIFIGCVIPEIQLFSFEDDILEVIDGKQRLSSIIGFLDNKYMLEGLEEIPELNGFFYKDLSITLKRKLRNYSIHSRISYDSEKIDKYKIFIRLNKGSKTLNSQEVKNCVYSGRLMNKIKYISNLDLVKEMIPIDNTRMDRDEVILRILSFSYCYNKKWSNSSQCTIMFLEEYKNSSDKMLDEFEKEIIANLLKIKKVIGLDMFFNNVTMTHHISKKESTKQKFLKTMFESLYIAISKYNLDVLIPKSKIIQNEMLICKQTSEEFLKTMYTGSNSKRNIDSRILILSSIIRKNI